MNMQFSPERLSRPELEIDKIMLASIYSCLLCAWTYAIWLRCPFSIPCDKACNVGIIIFIIWMEKLRLMGVNNLIKPHSWHLAEADTNHRLVLKARTMSGLCHSTDLSMGPVRLS